jgi:hypothetical protein
LILRWPDRPDRFGRRERQGGADIEEVLVLPGFRGRGTGNREAQQHNRSD